MNQVMMWFERHKGWSDKDVIDLILSINITHKLLLFAVKIETLFWTNYNKNNFKIISNDDQFLKPYIILSLTTARITELKQPNINKSSAVKQEIMIDVM